MPKFTPTNPPARVFTPRASDINDRMYVRREELEEKLRRALSSTKFIVIHGESGNGKTWLYKKIFRELDVFTQVMNLSTADSMGSLSAAIESKMAESGIEPDFGSVSSLLRFVQYIRHQAGSRQAVLVLDNFEQVVDNDKILREIAAAIISADDESVAAANVKIVIVGTPNDIRAMISKLASGSTISNRLTEIPEVARMSQAEAVDLIERGLEREIGLNITVDKTQLLHDISWKTDRIAQHIHEFCLNIAYEAIKNDGEISNEVVSIAERQWMDEYLSADWAIIDGIMNARETRAGRKNQVIFALGQCETEDFTSTDIERIVRDEFPVSTANVGLNVIQILAGFSKESSPMIRRTPKNNAYRLVSPKFRMAIRSRLAKNDHERVIVV
ncbi:ATP-binding protein [Brevundimonas lutea]|uniref:ATP-binding protein n=1 Tax=Brevundimonas lutea TaxID=2293980 RepID=UPI000F039C54|nr:ATP-binding protein [Brevundimonas lutea]